MFTRIIRFVAIKCGWITKPDYSIIWSPEQINPKEIKSNQIVLVGTKANPKWACFHCPGECNTFLRLPLSNKRNPHWTVETDLFKRPSVFPSVHQKNACHAHFWIKAGTVFQCGDSRCE